MLHLPSKRDLIDDRRCGSAQDARMLPFLMYQLILGREMHVVTSPILASYAYRQPNDLALQPVQCALSLDPRASVPHVDVVWILRDQKSAQPARLMFLISPGLF